MASSWEETVKYCSHCAGTLEVRVPENDNIARHVCRECGRVFYQNPKVVVGTLPYWEDKILICKRAIEPRKGYWTLPSGFLENGETVEAGALRETKEEAGADVSIDRLLAVFSLPHVNQVYLIFQAQLSSLDYSPGEESEEVRLVKESDIPWNSLAFRAIEFALECYLGERAVKLETYLGSYSREKNEPWIRGRHQS